MENGKRLGPMVVKPQKQPVVDKDPMATTEAKVSVVNLFERDIESTFSSVISLTNGSLGQ